MARKKALVLSLRIRSYLEEARFVSVWLVRQDGAARSCLLWGELAPAAAEELTAVLGLPVERETVALALVTPLLVPGCASVAQQGELFAGD